MPGKLYKPATGKKKNLNPLAPGFPLITVENVMIPGIKYNLAKYTSVRL